MHIEAIKNYNEQSINMINKVKVIKTPERLQVHPKDKPFSSGTINGENIIGKVKVKINDQFGNEQGFIFNLNGINYGIIGQEYTEIVKLSECIQKQKDYRNVLSLNYIKELLIGWIEDNFVKKPEISFIDFLEQNKEKEVKPYSILIPLQHMSTEQEFDIGNVRIMSISDQLIDQWVSKTNKEINAEESKSLNEYKLKIKKELQGFIAAKYECVAEKDRAIEIGLAAISDAFMILRLFSPANLFAQVKSSIDIDQWKVDECRNVLIIDRTNNGFSQNLTLLERNKYWIIPKIVSDFLRNSKLSAYNKLLLIENRNEYQTKIYEALHIYSKHSLRKDVFDKLLYILVSIEFILLKNDSEPIVQNISDRIAFFFETDANKRKAITEQVKNIYSIRSRFIHHGKPVTSQFEEINTFLNLAWCFFCKLVENIDNFKAKNDLLNFIDHIKYS